MSKRKAETEKEGNGKKGKVEEADGEQGMPGGVDIKAIMTAEGPVCTCVVLRATGAIEEISLDFSPKERNVEKTLGGPVDFLGQWIDIAVMIVERKDQDDESIPISVQKLQPPFHEAEIRGDLLLYRCDDDGLPEDFTKEDYEDWQKLVIEPWHPDDDEEDEDDDEDGDNGEEDADQQPNDNDDDDQALFEYLIQEHILKFTDIEKRPPTEEELERITEVVQMQIEQQKMEMEEVDDDDDDDDDEDEDYEEEDDEGNREILAIDEDDEDYKEFLEHLITQMTQKFIEANQREPSAEEKVMIRSNAQLLAEEMITEMDDGQAAMVGGGADDDTEPGDDDDEDNEGEEEGGDGEEEGNDDEDDNDDPDEEGEEEEEEK